MPSKQKHRGQHSNDARLFHSRNHAKLNAAVRDYSWLMSRGYPENAGMKLVGDRYRLVERQRKAVLRASCADASLTHRAVHEIDKAGMEGSDIVIDGYNLLITIESGLAGGIILDCRDDCYRDIASVHGTYRRVEETIPALTIIGDALTAMGTNSVLIYLDKPVSNSGRLRWLMEDIAREHGFNWEVWLVNNPDREIIKKLDVVTISSDRWVLDRSHHWFNLNAEILSGREGVNIVPLKGDVPLTAE